MNSPSGRPNRRTPIVVTIVSLAIVIAAVIIVVAVQRHREQSATKAQSGGMTNMPGMAMPGMAGAPQSPSAGDAAGSVTLSAAQERQLGVTFGSVEMRSLVADTRAVGVVTVDESRLAQVAPKFSGFVERLYVNETGQSVARGQPILDIYSPDVLAAEQELLLAEQLQQNIGQSSVPGVPPSTTDLVAAAKRRLELWDIAPAQIDEVIRTHTVRRAFTLYSPAPGVVVQKNVIQGQAISAGQTLYTIADLSDVWIDAQLREADAAAARTGAGADIEVTGLPGPMFKGRVAYVYPTLDSASRAVRARVVVSNTDGALKPGMYATVHLHSASRSVLTVPTSAVLRTGTRNVVFVDMGGGHLMPMEIEVGQTAGDFTEVLSGLEPGQRVATSAQFLLDSESNLGEVMRSMISQMSSGEKQP
jgi:multidrug efflux pump subunit AcrA (membrane-fusion protein)